MNLQLDSEEAMVETARLQRELDITNADHVALWLEANTIPDEPMSQCISWLACRIVEAHEAAIRDDGWRAIEDAPKDGTRILLWIEPTKIAMPFEWKEGRWMGDDYPLNMAWPTNWRPLRSPPSSKSEAPGVVGGE